MSSRIDRIEAAHPEISVEDIRIILSHYYRLEWSMPGATLWDVRNTLEHITQSLVDAPQGSLQGFVDAIKDGKL